MDLPIRPFLFGLLGSAAIEVLYLYNLFRSGKPRLPAHIGHVRYWIVRVLLAIVGGALAAAYGIQSDILAVHIGASAPAILEQLAREPPAQAR